MKILLLSLLAFLFTTLSTFAQHEADNWYFGIKAGITFKNGAPTAVSGGQLTTDEGCSSYSDKTTGALLLYTDGTTVWNGSHQIITNGTGLNGGYSSTQSALIVPNPGNNMQFYIFTLPHENSKPSGLFYSLVSLEGSMGEVISKNIFLVDSVSEKLTGTIDFTRTGFWIMTHHRQHNIFYTFHVTSSGVDINPVQSNYQTSVLANNYKDHGYLRISPDTKKVVKAERLNTSRVGYATLTLFDFNNATGVVSNPGILENGNEDFYGVAFSGDNTKLYALGTKHQIEDPVIYQYEVNLGYILNIKNSKTSVVSRKYEAAMALAPDGKIYLGSGTKIPYLSVINKPNEKWINCEYQNDNFLLTDNCFLGLPNFMDFNMDLEVFSSTICPGNSTKIGIPPVQGCVYSWTPTAGLDNSSIADPIASPAQTTKYTLSIVSGGVQSFRTYIVNVNIIKPEIEHVNPICFGSSVQLSASGGDSYLWSPAEGLDSIAIATPIATPKVPTTYTVVVTRGNCSDSASVKIDIIHPTANAGKDKIICYGSSIQIGDSISKNDESYTWRPTDGLNNPIIFNPIATLTKTTQFILEVWKNGCTAYDTVVVTVVPKTKAVVSGDTAICGGGSVQLLASGGSEYSWFPVTGLDNPTLSNPTASPLTTTKYKVIVSNGDCKDSAFVTVKVTPFSGAKAGADKTVCPNGSAQLGAPSEAGNTYSWQPATGLDNPTIANPTTSPSATIQYILTVTNATGCVAYDTVLVTVGNIVAKVSPDTAICSGSSVQLIASGGAEYVWSPSAGLSNSSSENPIATPAITTQYKVIVSSGTCKDSAFVTVTVNPQPTADAGPDQTICSGEPVNIGVPAIAGNTYSWQPPTGLSNATISNPTASPTITTEYILTVTSNGCVAFDTVVVKVGNLTAKVSADMSICAGKTAQLLASGGTKYVWSPSDGLNDTSIPNPTASPNSTTRYKVVVSSGSCIDSAFVTVTIAPPLIADAGNDRVICVGESTQIGTIADPANSYSWSPSTGLVSPLASQTTASPTTTTTYILTVTNPAGCVNYDTITISVNSLNERSFTLQPDTVIITPGQQFRVNLNVSSGVSDWGVRLGYNPRLVKYNSINNGLEAIADNQKGELVIRGTSSDTTNSITFDAFLPHTSDTIYPVKLSIDTAQATPCETSIAVGNILKLSDYCGKNIRVVSATGKSYFLTVKGNTIDFGVGLSGNVRLEVFDYLGNSMQILNDGNLEAGAYSAEIDLPTGVYFCRMRAGMYESVGKVLVGF